VTRPTNARLAGFGYLSYIVVGILIIKGVATPRRREM